MSGGDAVWRHWDRRRLVRPDPEPVEALPAVSPSSERAAASPGGARPSAHGSARGRDARYRELMERYLGLRVLDAFADDDVTEVYVNPHDGWLRLDTRSRGKVRTDARLRASRVEQFLGAVAAFHGDALGPAAPSVQAELPDGTFGGARLQGFVPPLVPRACFVVRKPARVVYDLDSYVRTGVMSARHRFALRDAIDAHENVLVCGGTGSGKTTLCNALLLEMTERFPDERIVVLEDTGELQCAADDHLQLQTSDDVSLADLVRHTLRCTPDRIVVGEVRDAAALDLLDAWATGAPRRVRDAPRHDGARRAPPPRPARAAGQRPAPARARGRGRRRRPRRRGRQRGPPRPRARPRRRPRRRRLPAGAGVTELWGRPDRPPHVRWWPFRTRRGRPAHPSGREAYHHDPPPSPRDP